MLNRSQRSVAIAIGVHPSRFGRWLSDPEKNKPTAEQLFLLARELGVSMEYLSDDGLDEDVFLDTSPDPRAIAIRAIIKEIGLDNALRRLPYEPRPARPVPDAAPAEADASPPRAPSGEPYAVRDARAPKPPGRRKGQG